MIVKQETELLLRENEYMQDFGMGNTWIPGEITELSGPVSFVVKCGDGKLIRRHQDHLRYRRDDQVTDQSHEQSDDTSDVWIDVGANVRGCSRSSACNWNIIYTNSGGDAWTKHKETVSYTSSSPSR